MVFLDESGFLLLPVIRRTWGPRGLTPLLRYVGRHRQKVSSVSVVTVSPLRRRLGLVIRFFPDKTIRFPQVLSFLRLLLAHLRGPLLVLWDRGRPHRATKVAEFLRRHRKRLWVEFFPSYAPELNPPEHGWAYLKYQRLANHGFPGIRPLHRRLLYEARRLRRRQDLLRSFIEASELPFRL